MKRVAASLVVLLISATASLAFASESSVDPVLCKALTKHTPSADVAYQPGVDVHGKKVVPADLADQSAMEIPQRFDIPLTASMFKLLNLSTTNFPFNSMNRTDINLGVLTVDGDQVLYNGQPLSGAQQENLAVLCLQPDQPQQKPTALKP